MSITFTEVTTAGGTFPNGNLWEFVSISPDGSKALACANGVGGGVWYSASPGTPDSPSWVSTSLTTTLAWQSVAISGNATSGYIGLACASSVGGVGGGIWYTSSPTLNSWIQLSGGSFPTDLVWLSVSLSSDGSKALACANGGGVWYSAEPTLYSSWTQLSGSSSFLTTLDWKRVSLSGDGLSAVACTTTGSIFHAAEPGSAGNWGIVTDTTGGWTAISLSSNGSKALACGGGGGVWYSTSPGTAWTSTTLSTIDAWSGVSISADGSTGLACSNGSGIWYVTNVGSTSTWTELGITSTYTWTSINLSLNGSTTVAMAASESTGVWYWSFPQQTQSCFLAGSQISMADNTFKSIEKITVGEKVISCFSNAPITVKRVWHNTIQGSKLEPDNVPFCIPKSFIAKENPSEDVFLSGFHRIIVTSETGERVGVQTFKFPGLLPVKYEEDAVDYYHIELDSDFTDGVYVSGMPVEALEHEGDPSLH